MLPHVIHHLRGEVGPPDMSSRAGRVASPPPPRSELPAVLSLVRSALWGLRVVCGDLTSRVVRRVVAHFMNACCMLSIARCMHDA